MKQDIGAAAHRLAGDHRLSDYDFWRALKNLDNEIYRKAGEHQPIPIDMIRWRAIIKQARSQARRQLAPAAFPIAARSGPACRLAATFRPASP